MSAKQLKNILQPKIDESDVIDKSVDDGQKNKKNKKKNRRNKSNITDEIEETNVDEFDQVDESRQTNQFALLNNEEEADAENEEEDNLPDNNDDDGRKKRKKNKKKQPKIDDDDEQMILAAAAASSDWPTTLTAGSKSKVLQLETDLFKIDHRCLNYDNEMRRIFGAKFRVADSSTATHSAAHHRQQRFVGKLVKRNQQWPEPRNIGLSMQLDQTEADGTRIFSYVHGNSYQTAQNAFWTAVDNMDHDGLGDILREYPYHVDTLLQVAEGVRANQEFQVSRDLIERALFICEHYFHPLFNITTFGCRLPYRQWENRALYLAIYRHMIGLCERGCYRTALEFSKLLYSLDPNEDPMGMLLYIDCIAIRAKQYDYLISLYDAMKDCRNLDQLPNFCYSIALALFLKTRDQESPNVDDRERADKMLELAVVRFPSLLLPLLEKCDVEADKDVVLFCVNAQHDDSSGLTLLIRIYVTHCALLWKDANVLEWLESSVRRTMQQIQSSSQLKQKFSSFQQIRRTRYIGIPTNVRRHAALCSIEVDNANTTILSYDPVPPIDSIARYRPPEPSRIRDTFFAGFLRSLMPTYRPEEAAAAEPPLPFHDTLRGLVTAVRDLIDNVQLQVAPPAPDDDQQPPPDNR